MAYMFFFFFFLHIKLGKENAINEGLLTQCTVYLVFINLVLFF